MNEMQQRIARAIEDASSHREGIEPLAAAIKILMVMWEPTDQMLAAARQPQYIDQDPEVYWHLMIDEALKP